LLLYFPPPHRILLSQLGTSSRTRSTTNLCISTPQPHLPTQSLCSPTSRPAEGIIGIHQRILRPRRSLPTFAPGAGSRAAGSCMIWQSARQGKGLWWKRGIVGLPLSQPLCWGLANGIPGVLRFRPLLWGLKHFDITLQYDFRERFVLGARETECEAALETGCGSAASCMRDAVRCQRNVPHAFSQRAQVLGKATWHFQGCCVRLFRIAGASPPYPSTIPPLIEPLYNMAIPGTGRAISR
jgi:hypothetical protein